MNTPPDSRREAICLLASQELARRGVKVDGVIIDEDGRASIRIAPDQASDDGALVLVAEFEVDDHLARADKYFKDHLGLTDDSPLRIPCTRRGAQ